MLDTINNIVELNLSDGVDRHPGEKASIIATLTLDRAPSLMLSSPEDAPESLQIAAEQHSPRYGQGAQSVAGDGHASPPGQPRLTREEKHWQTSKSISTTFFRHWRIDISTR